MRGTDCIRLGVAMPVKDAVAYVETALRAIQRQTRRPDRIVVVDNGSRDGTIELLERLQAEMGFELRTEATPGASAARDAAWRLLADCDLVAFCDADDLWQENKLEQQVNAFMGDGAEDLVCVYCANTIISSSGTLVGRSPLPTLRGLVHEAVAQGEPILGSMSSAVVRRDALERAGGFDRSLLADEDLDLFIRLSRLGRFDFVPQHLVALRLHGANSSLDFERLLRSKGAIINKYPELYEARSTFVKMVRLNYMHSDLARRSWLSRLFAACLYPFVFRAAVYRNTCGRATSLLFPGLVRYSLWLAGRVELFVSNGIRKWVRAA